MNRVYLHELGESFIYRILFIIREYIWFFDWITIHDFWNKILSFNIVFHTNEFISTPPSILEAPLRTGVFFIWSSSFAVIYGYL
jgi:hypothetical protein